MRIDNITLRKLHLPLKIPFKTGFGEIIEKQTLIIELVSGSVTGYGEASSLHAPIYNEESVDGCHLFLSNFLIPQIIGQDFNSINDFVEVVNKFKGNNIAKAGIENAFIDAFSKSNNIPINEIVKGERERIMIGANSIGIQETLDETLTKVEKELSKGLSRIKLKIKPGWDIEVLIAVRDTFPNIEIMVDGNASYEFEKHKKNILELDKYDLTMVEQPFSETSINDHAKIQTLMSTKICLDESIRDLQTAKESSELGACKVVNIKQGRVGGLINACRINQLLYKNGIACWCGGMLESSIGRAFNIFIATLENFTYPADISPFDHYFEDIVSKEPFPIIDGCYIEPPKTLGIGFEPSMELMDKYTVSKKELSSNDRS